MRFLLHRAPRTVLAKLAKSQKKAKPGPAALDGGRRMEVDTNAVREIVATGTTGQNHVQWGQQCSPSCGCVIRFQASVDPETRRYESVDYVARQVVTHGESGASLLTARGRPMIKECTCKTLHHLASVAAHHLQGKTTCQAANMVEFQSTRSSTAFRQVALSTQGLPKADTGCFDVMEEALTAMVKGHMIAFRPKENLDQPRVTFLKGTGYHHRWTRNVDDDYNGHWFDFHKLWKDSEAHNVSGPMSTLSMLDLSMSILSGHEEEAADVPRTPTLPQDWQAYVDQLYEEENEQQPA